MPRFEEIPDRWGDGRPIIIIGGGASITRDQVERLRGLGHVIAVKASMFEIDWADVGFGVDVPRLNEWKARIASRPFDVWWAIPEDREVDEVPDNLKIIKRLRDPDLCDIPDTIHCGGTSGFGALSFAWSMLGPDKKGAEIYLFGYDYKPTCDIWHRASQYYGMKRVQRPENWYGWAKRFDEIKDKIDRHGVDVFNVGMDSAIQAFPKLTFEEALDRLAGEKYGNFTQGGEL